MLEKKKITLVPSYGPEMRGGTANCTVILKDGEIYSPVVAHPDILIALNLPSLERFEASVKTKGMIFYNATFASPQKKRKDVSYFGVPANDLANEAGSVKAANVTLLGALIEETHLVKEETLMEKVLPKVFSNKKAALLELNKTALQKGRDYQKNKTAV
ncbi:2-oxoacid:acceptor oxidoreductase family protein, partial [Candidatus Sumerlaeota bacterium]|nr:2-oxoacid:acceptor oxidoreductase family protein [Candidatus Sumerlaeota bacterium]